LGHQAGDALIRRAAEVLKSLPSNPARLSRASVEMSLSFSAGCRCAGGQRSDQRITDAGGLNNKSLPPPELSISVGAATRQVGLSLERSSAWPITSFVPQQRAATITAAGNDISI